MHVLPAEQLKIVMFDMFLKTLFNESSYLKPQVRSLDNIYTDPRMLSAIF